MKPRRRPRKKFVLSSSPYPWDVILHIGGKEESEAYQRRRGYSNPEHGHNGGEVASVSEDGWVQEIYAWVNGFEWQAEKVGSLVHELLHATQLILKKCGVEDDEAQAYLLESLVKQALAKIPTGRKLK